jgi:Big-like domain-containing protein
MFHGKPARRDGAGDHRIDNSPTAAHPALGGLTSQLLRKSLPRRSAVVRWSKAGRGAGVRPRLFLLLVALVALNVVLTGTALAAAQDASGRSLGDIVRLELQPTGAVIAVGAQVTYHAKGVFLDGIRADVTRYTTFSVNPDGPCTMVRGKRGLTVSCEKPGSYSVGGVLARVPFFADTAELEVVTGSVPPQIWSVEPDSSPPNKEILVGGTIGSCNPSGMLTLRTRRKAEIPLAVRGGENGNFTVPLTIPPGIFPGTHQLELGVRCDGQPQRVEANLEVTNRPPEVVDHSVTTDENKSVAIDITAGSGDPDGDDGYQTALLVTPPGRGTAEVQRDNEVVYTPAPGFIGRDRFRYSLCDVIDAKGTGACGTASITVTVIGDDSDDSTTSSTEESTTSSGEASTTSSTEESTTSSTEESTTSSSQASTTTSSTAQSTTSSSQASTTASTEEATTSSTAQSTTSSMAQSTTSSSQASTTSSIAQSTTSSIVQSRAPSISTVAPGLTFPGMSVEITGNTGSCTRAGVLIVHGMAADVRMNVNGGQQGNFVARFIVPKGTFPRSYTVELVVDCNGQLQRAEGELSVLNIAPTPVDDRASTLLDTPVAIDVTANDRNPDPDSGYPTLVLVSSRPLHGTAEVLPDNRIGYTPAKGFSGQDRFQYSFCDDVVNAAGTADCGTATVTVTVDRHACVPPAGASPPLHVDPVKGSGGTKLRITATVDGGLATCPLRLLLGGTRLGPDVQVGPDGSIAAERGVPGDARAGSSPMRLTTLTAQTVAEAPFEVVPPDPPWLRLLRRLLIGAGALLAGALVRAAFRGRRGSQKGRRAGEPPENLRAEPHTRPVEVTVEPEHDNTRTLAVRLEPHPDPGNQTSGR